MGLRLKADSEFTKKQSIDKLKLPSKLFEILFSFSMSRVNMKGSRYTEDLLPNLKMTVSDTKIFY